MTEVVTFFGLPDREENPLMAKYSKEQRDRAVDLYIKYERCAADVDWLQCIRQSDEGRMT